MIKIIVTGHGHFATGIQSTMDYLQVNQGYLFVDFVESDSDVTLKEKFEEIIVQSSNPEIVFFCDLFGGTPYKAAASLAFENNPLAVVAGCNIGSLMEMLFTKEDYDINGIVNQIISASNIAMGFFEKENTK